MKLLIMSDTHDNFKVVDDIAKIAAKENINSFIHCGDITSAKMIYLLNEKSLANGFFVLGNMDKDNIKEIKEATKKCNYEFVGLSSVINIEDNKSNIKIFVTHGDNKDMITEALSKKEVKYIFYGHTHKKEIKKIGDITLVNVGALKEDTPKDDKGVFILDTIKDELKFININ